MDVIQKTLNDTSTIFLQVKITNCLLFTNFSASTTTEPSPPDATSTQTYSQSTDIATGTRKTPSATTSDVFTPRNDTSHTNTFQSEQSTDLSTSSEDLLLTDGNDLSTNESSTMIVYRPPEKTFCDRNLIIGKKLYSIKGWFPVEKKYCSATCYVFNLMLLYLIVPFGCFR